MSGWEAQRAQLRPTPQYQREFTCTEVDVSCGSSSKNAGTLKKTRKVDKRESHGSRTLLDDTPRKLKERPSWLSISRQPSSSLAPSGSWRPVTCNLLDDNGQANLRLYTEDQHLQHSVHVNALFGPNLRIVDPTLLSRRHVLAIHGHTPASTPSTSASASASTTSTPTSYEPIYLAFRNRDMLNAWFVLLRSFARPDIRTHPYLASLSYSHTASYRIWRHLQINVIQGRRFPIKLIQEKISSDESNSKDRDKDLDKDIWELFLEVTLNGASVGRTGAKFVPGVPWQAERIVVMDPDLGGGTWAGSGGVDTDFAASGPELTWGTGPPTTTSALLDIRIWRTKTQLFGLSTTTHVASVPIDLGPFRRGEPVKAWWPGFSQGPGGQQDGELMLEIKFDEEIILPLEAYRRMKEILARRNYFELWQDITTRIPVPISTSTHLISLALHHGTLASHLAELACAEINSPRTSPSTLFRGNSLLTRLVESTMALLGARGFLESSVGHVVRKMYREKVVFEPGAGGPPVGPSTAGGVTEGAELMAHWLREMWNSIWRARSECPEELRQLFFQIRTRVDERWGSSALHADLKYQAISAFLFLRFFVPALLRPDQHSLIVGPPPEGVERSLKSLARALQSLANLNTSVQREEFMRSVKTFNEENVDAMIDYLISVSTPSNTTSVPPASSSAQLHNALHLHPTMSHSRASAPESQIRAAIQARLPGMTQLHRESLPVLPYMTDEARDLAAIASAVVRNARTPRGLERGAQQEVGPMNEGLEGLDEEGGVGVSNADVGDEQNTDTAGTEESQSEAQQDVIRFVKACFDVQAEAMRRVAPSLPGTGLAKKHPRRRRRKTEDKSARVEDGRSLGGSTPSAEGSVDAREVGQMTAVGPSTNMGSEYLVGSILSADPNVRPGIVQRPLSDTKKRKGMFRFMSGSRK